MNKKGEIKLPKLKTPVKAIRIILTGVTKPEVFQLLPSAIKQMRLTRPTDRWR
jgi:hypothetical protein